MSRKLLWIYLAILIFTPLAFGTVEQWSLTIMEGLTLFALLALLVCCGRKEGMVLYKIPGIVPLLCLWTYFIIQAIPLPSVVIKAISSETYRIYSETAGVFGTVPWVSLSVQKKATLLEFLRFSCYGAFYILTVQLLSRKEALKKTVEIIVLFSAVVALFAILQNLFSGHKIFWFMNIALGSPFGPFVNRNHYAGFMGMVFPVVLSLFLTLRPKMKYDSLRDRIAGLLSQKHTNTYILIGIAAILIALSVFLSLSRGGIVCLGLTTMFLVGALLLKTRNRRRASAIVLISLLIAGVVCWIGWGPVLERFASIKDSQGNIADYRPEIWSNCLSMIRDFPLTGTGFGTFVSSYPAYRSFATEWTIDHAHNDYLELLTDGGLVAFLFAAWFLLSILYSSYMTFRRRKDSYSIYLYLGCLAGMFSIFLHSVVDFNLHIGSNGLYFFFLAGLAVSAANTRLHEGLAPTYLRPLSYSIILPVRFAALAMLVFCIIFNVGILAGDHYFNSIRDLKITEKTGEKDLAGINAVALKASVFDPLEAKYAYAAATIETRMHTTEAAVSSYKQAVVLDPLNAEYVQRLGLLLSEKGDPEKGERLIRAGVIHDVSNSDRYKLYSLWLISRGNKVEALANIRKALTMSPDKSEDFIMLMMLRGMNYEEMLSALPQRAAPYLAFGDYLTLSGKNEAAEKSYQDALYYESKEKVIRKTHFDKVYRYYIKRERLEEALGVMKQATAALPVDGELHFTTGTLYEKLGMNSFAAEEYKKALKLDPRLIEADRKLEAILSKTGKSAD
jgi:O-antigen ligase/tetratricopeptide (TPR) repeat protein